MTQSILKHEIDKRNPKCIKELVRKNIAKTYLRSTAVETSTSSRSRTYPTIWVVNLIRTIRIRVPTEEGGKLIGKIEIKQINFTLGQVKIKSTEMHLAGLDN